MSTVVVKQAHSLTPEEAKARLKPFEEELSSKYMLKLDWSGNKAELKGAAASGGIDVGASEVVVTVKLGMMAKMAGVKPDKLEASLKKRLDAALA